jgi:hypothetical protein
LLFSLDFTAPKSPLFFFATVIKPSSAGLPGYMVLPTESVFPVVGTYATAFTAVGFWIELITCL